MLKRLLYIILAPHHPWRKVSFSDLSELYISSMLRDFAQSMVGIFIPIYLVNNGFSVADALFFFALFYAFGLFGVNEIIGRCIAWFGPKHVIGASFFLQVLFFLMLASLPDFRWSLWQLALSARIASCAYYMSFHVSFSKMSHGEHAGKELGLISIASKIASVAGPFAGGIVATFFGAQSIIIIATLVFGLAIIPLLASGEFVKTRQKFTYKGIPIKKMRRTLIVNSLSNLENGLTIWLWPLYVGIFIFTTEPYLKLGIVSSIGAAVSILAAIMVGRLIDRKKAHELFTWSVIINSGVHVIRLLASSFRGVILVNILNEPTTTAYRMTFMNGYYDSTDNYPGYRIAYITLSENIMDGLRSFVWAGLGLAALYFTNSQQSVVASGFIIAAIVSLLVLFQKFPTLKKQ